MNIIDIHHVATSNGPWKLEKIQGPSCNSPFGDSVTSHLVRARPESHLADRCGLTTWRGGVRRHPTLHASTLLSDPRYSYLYVGKTLDHAFPFPEYSIRAKNTRWLSTFFFFSQTHPWPPIQTVRSNFFTVKRLRDEAFNIKQVYLRRLRVVGSNFW